MPPCLTLSIIRYGSRVKWSNPAKGVAPSPTPCCSSYWKGSLRVTLDYGRQLYFYFIILIYIYIYIYIYICVCVCGLGSFFNGISNCLAYLMPKWPLQKQHGYYLTPSLVGDLYVCTYQPLHTGRMWHLVNFAQSAGAIEYTDCTSAEG